MRSTMMRDGLSLNDLLERAGSPPRSSPPG
jgi:hypothetical protein